MQEKLKSAGEMPRHVAIIMDGNGRWAKQRGLPRIAGHNEGVESVRDIVEACGQLGIDYLTLYAWSTENWKRPQEEVSLLMRLLLKALKNETDRLHRNNVRLKTIGDIERLPRDVHFELLDDIERTSSNTGLTLTLALSYSGRWDITEAVKRIATSVHEGNLTPDQLTDELISGALSTAGVPDPDLLIRTSGEMRISNFLLWQLAYAEIVVSPHYWPGFRRNNLYDAIQEYQKRERRFGMVSEQLQASNGESYFNKLIRSVTGS
ncbi:MAG: isoprenyl transferase [Bacteroidota bacterium]